MNIEEIAEERQSTIDWLLKHYKRRFKADELNKLPAEEVDKLKDQIDWEESQEPYCDFESNGWRI